MESYTEFFNNFYLYFFSFTSPISEGPDSFHRMGNLRLSAFKHKIATDSVHFFGLSRTS